MQSSPLFAGVGTDPLRVFVKKWIHAAMEGLVIRRGRLRGRVFLTFDDGPHPENTDKILEILRNLGARATFFVTGAEVEKHPEIPRRIVSQGHEVASHSWSHRRYPHLDFGELHRDIVNAEKIIYETCGVTTRSYRPPYGRLTVPLLYYAWGRGMKIVLWSLDSEDDRGRSVQLILDNCRHASEGDIILFHDDNQAVMKALPEAIQRMRSRGLDFGTVREIR